MPENTLFYGADLDILRRYVVAEFWRSRRSLWTDLFVALAWETLFLARSSLSVCRSQPMSKYALPFGLQAALLEIVALKEGCGDVDSAGGAEWRSNDERGA